MKRCAFVLAALLAGCHAERDANRAALSSPDPTQRAQAANALARSGDPDDLGYLVSHVGDPDPLVRAAVAEGLGHFDDRHAADALAELTEDSNEAVQVQAVGALGRFKTPRAHSYLLLAYRRSGPRVRAAVADALRAAGSSPAEAVEAEARALYEEYSRDLAGSGSARLTAAEQLGHSGRPEVVERLTGYLGAEPHALAIAAARGLGASGAPEARPSLEALLLEEDPDLQLAGAQALGALGDPGAAPALLRTIVRGGRAADAALRSLLALSSPGGALGPQLCAAALSANPDLAKRAGEAIRARKVDCEVDAFVAKLRSGHGSELAGPLAGLAEVWRADVAPAAKDDAADSDDDDPRAKLKRPIAELLRYGTPDVRPLAARAATSLGLADLLPDLIKARQEAEAQIEQARERWIKAPLPRVFTEGFGNGDSAPGPTHAQVQKLLGKLGDLGVETAAEDPARLPSLFSPAPPTAIALWAEASLGEVRFGEQPAARLGSLRGDPLSRVRLAAVEGVRWLPKSAQWAALTPLLDDPDLSVRAAAVATAGALDPSIAAAGQWLLDEIENAGSEPDLPLDALIEAVGRHPELAKATAALGELLDRPDAAPAAARALAALGTPDAKAKLLAALNGTRGIALDALLSAVGQVGDPAAIPACKRLLFHTQPEVRAAAVGALGRLLGGAATAEVQPLAEDYNRRVRQAVLAASKSVH